LGVKFSSRLRYCEQKIHDDRQLFRTIKAVGNFPYVTYLLAFDKEVVENALEDVQKGLSGRQYLEKIVQVPLPLPMPEPGSVHKMLTDKLDALIVDTPEQYWQRDRWALAFSNSVQPLIQTPRDVIRLVNLLQLTYPDLDGDVNPVDFIGINLISVVRPELYDLVRHNKNMFIGEAHDSSRGRYYQERDEQFHTKWRDAIPEEQRERHRCRWWDGGTRCGPDAGIGVPRCDDHRVGPGAPPGAGRNDRRPGRRR